TSHQVELRTARADGRHVQMDFDVPKKWNAQPGNDVVKTGRTCLQPFHRCLVGSLRRCWAAFPIIEITFRRGGKRKFSAVRPLQVQSSWNGKAGIDAGDGIGRGDQIAIRFEAKRPVESLANK